jgi:hypothetical protein
MVFLLAATSIPRASFSRRLHGVLLSWAPEATSPLIGLDHYYIICSMFLALPPCSVCILLTSTATLREVLYFSSVKCLPMCVGCLFKISCFDIRVWYIHGCVHGEWINPFRRLIDIEGGFKKFWWISWKSFSKCTSCASQCISEAS